MNESLARETLLLRKEHGYHNIMLLFFMLIPSSSLRPPTSPSLLLASSCSSLHSINSRHIASGSIRVYKSCMACAALNSEQVRNRHERERNENEIGADNRNKCHERSSYPCSYRYAAGKTTSMQQY